MEDRQVREISAALKDIASAIGALAFAVWISAITLGSCIAASHH